MCIEKGPMLKFTTDATGTNAERYRLTADGQMLRNVNGEMVPWVVDRDAADFLETLDKIYGAI